MPAYLNTIGLLTRLAAAVTCLSAFCFAQSIESGWKGIVPFKTDMATVEKLLGSPEIHDNGYYRYSSKEAIVRVNYSSTPCAADPKYPRMERGKYSIPAGTVLDYDVVLRKVVTLAELKLDLTKYYRDTSGDVIGAVRYYEYIEGTSKISNNGVSIGVGIEQGVEYVGTITYYPREREKNAAACKNVKS